ncbi:hypothetical protein P872_24910 [Rhodonellum psychrophilum GCM71 = DSM 17998]|uniref:Uncharacterized protein n=1 Tax=Rhodonellum psychrophilum GCM71 = DSM 17998 TaxID=1123057 RepID=U5BUU7_9BACT|nr:hypothetical protein P872_24910 [Rhodonellum psychrophilum GCM71 = DSM 17998]
MFGFHKCGLIQWFAEMVYPLHFLIDIKKSFVCRFKSETGIRKSNSIEIARKSGCLGNNVNDRCREFKNYK